MAVSQKRLLIGLALLTLVVGALFYRMTMTEPLAVLNATSKAPVTSLPDFEQYQDIKAKKQAFFDFLRPIIKEQNDFIRAQRVQVSQYAEQFKQGNTFSEQDLEVLQAYAEAYDLDEQPFEADFFAVLLRRVDVIPPSLALAQAAIESGWGSSRFAKEGNNLFGHWCFSKGCGFVPLGRDDNKYHEVAKFKTVNEAVRKYMRNLNAYHPYTPMRQIRLAQRTQQQAVTGLVLIHGLLDYSQMKDQYIAKVVRMIKQNKLTRYDDAIAVTDQSMAKASVE